MYIAAITTCVIAQERSRKEDVEILSSQMRLFGVFPSVSNFYMYISTLRQSIISAILSN